MEKLKQNIGSFLYKAGISANFVSFVGLFFALLAGLCLAQGRFRLGAVVLLLGGLLDMVDGAIARASGSTNKFGGVLDSSLDRYGDGFVLGGALFYCARHGLWSYAALSFSALLGAFLISYVRARAECVIPDCRVGFWERGERIGLLVAALLWHNLAAALWILGVATHGTVWMRLWHSHRMVRGGQPPPAIRARSSPAYLLKAGLFLALIFLWRPGL